MMPADMDTNSELRIEFSGLRSRRTRNLYLIHLVRVRRKRTFPFRTVGLTVTACILDEDIPTHVVLEQLAASRVLGLYAEGNPVPVLVDGDELLYLVGLGPDGRLIKVTDEYAIVEDKRCILAL